MAAIIHLIGYPGVGKLTVAHALAATTPEGAADRVVVVDNHLTGDPVLRVTALDADGRVPQRAWELVAEIRERVHTAIVELSPPGWSFVFTNVLRKGDPLLGQTDRATRGLAESLGVPYVPVVLRCDPAEQRRRVVGADRVERHKWTDPDGVAAYVEQWELATPGGPNQLELDTTDLAPADAARAILAHIQAL
ncbi:MAG TPA: AAA family ATPase [Acidimicrobiales bacterium]|nr:AAA family ATPase [Acidimicrobiales bacterium]